jgi:hypothetical protein
LIGRFLPTASAAAAISSSSAAAATAAATAVSTTATAAAISSSSAAAATAATAVTTTATATAATATTASSVFCFFYYNGSSINLSFVEPVDSILGFVVVWHFNKSKAFGTASEFISNNVARTDYTVFLECGLKVISLRVVVQFCYEDVHFTKN